MSYVGAPLDRATEVTGHPVATVHLASSEPDCALIVYVEDVAPDGTCRYVTEGVMRALHRKTGSAPEALAQSWPTHSFRAADADPPKKRRVGKPRPIHRVTQGGAHPQLGQATGSHRSHTGESARRG